MSVDLSSDPVQALLLKPHAGPAVAGIARIEENNAGMVERFLNCSECAGTRIGPTALEVFYSDFGETRRFSQLGLRPIEEPASRADLSGRDHSYTIVEDVRNDNFGLPRLSPAELATATRNAQSKLRGLIQRLRRSLARSRFLLVTHVTHGYELIVREEE